MYIVKLASIPAKFSMATIRPISQSCSRPNSSWSSTGRPPRHWASQFVWNCEAQCLGGLPVDDQLEFGRLHDWEIGRIVAMENLAGIDANLTIYIVEAGPVADQTARRHKLTPPVHCWDRISCRQRRQLILSVAEERI